MMNELSAIHVVNNHGQQAPPRRSGNTDNVFQSYRRPYSSSIQCLIVVTIITIFAGSIITVLVLVWPRSPKFQITSVSICPFYISNSHLTAVWNITFDVKNKNKGSLSYEDVMVSVYYKNTNALLISANQSSFHQPKKSLIKYEVIISAFSLLIANNSVNAFAGDLQHGIVAFNIKMHAKSIYVPLPLVSRRHQVTVNCNNVKLGFGPNNSFSVIMGRFKRCQVN